MPSTAKTLRNALAAWALSFAAALALAPQAAGKPYVMVRGLMGTRADAPPTYADCEAAYQAACYSPQDIRHSYGVDHLVNAGLDGAGQTIVLIESYGSPTVEADLQAFDAGYGLPDPPSLTVLSPLGSVPWDPTTYPDQPGWGFETSLDVQWAHAMAPGAAIVVLTSPVDETEGVQGLPEFLQLEQYALDHRLGKIISQSWGATENTLFPDAAGPEGLQVVQAYEELYTRAQQQRVTVFASAGDNGTSNQESDGVTFYPFPTVGFPASSPLVTAVGGTDLEASSTGVYQSEHVWNDDGCCAGGGGISQLFSEPGYQRLSLPRGVQRQLGRMRGLPDVSYNAAVADEFIFVYASFPGSGGAGYYGIGGTSEGAPQWAGITADLNQHFGRPLGFLNPTFYTLGAVGLFGKIGRDVTVGNNGLEDVPGAVAPGYDATPGWDLASGWGTPNLANLPAVLRDYLNAGLAAAEAER
jgi:subtilase family serine protease